MAGQHLFSEISAIGKSGTYMQQWFSRRKCELRCFNSSYSHMLTIKSETSIKSFRNKDLNCKTEIILITMRQISQTLTVQSTSVSVYILSWHVMVLGSVLTCAIHAQQRGKLKHSKTLLRVTKFLWRRTVLLPK